MINTPIDKQEKKNKKKWLWLLLLLLLLIGSAFGIYHYFFKTDPGEKTVQVVSGEYLPDTKDATKMTDEEVKKLEQDAVDSSKFNMIIKPEAVFQTADALGTLYIQNPIANAYPINVVITLDESNQAVYSSGAIQPGYEINGAKLDVPLEAGEYPATATFNIYDPETNQKRGQVQAAITIEVLS